MDDEDTAYGGRKSSQFWYVNSQGSEEKRLFPEHPICCCFTPLDGEVWGFVEDIIDQQKYINRLIVLQDMIISASAKFCRKIVSQSVCGWTTFKNYLQAE